MAEQQNPRIAVNMDARTRRAQFAADHPGFNDRRSKEIDVFLDHLDTYIRHIINEETFRGEPQNGPVESEYRRIREELKKILLT